MTVFSAPPAGAVFFAGTHNGRRGTHTFRMDRITDLKQTLTALKRRLPAEDILIFSFRSADGRAFACVYADALTDKDLLGEQVLSPLMRYRGAPAASAVCECVTAPEVRRCGSLRQLADEVLAGNPVLLWEGMDEAASVGVKKIPVRAVAEPPTDVVTRGPREGFVEDFKTNTALVRRRLKTADLRIDTLTLGERSNTAIAVCYLRGIAPKTTVDAVKARLSAVEIDVLPDSSYLTHALSSRPHSLVKQVGTTEKPDIFCAKLAEGRVGILADGSPIALTVPYLMAEDFQSAEDYFVSAHRATLTRLLRLFALLTAIYLPAFYIAAQLFKLQLFPIKLLLTIAGSIRDIPLSPSLEMLLVLLVLEVLNEASIRMPKYVGMALSVVGALVLGETAVNAGFVSTPAIIIVAFSGIGLYAVPNLIEQTSVLRLAMLLTAGSVGTYGIVLLSAFVLLYLVTTENFGVPLAAPFAPLVRRDCKDALLKYGLPSLHMRPKSLLSRNKRRMK